MAKLYIHSYIHLVGNLALHLVAMLFQVVSASMAILTGCFRWLQLVSGVSGQVYNADLTDHTDLADQGHAGKRSAKQGPRFRILHRGKS